MLLHKRTVYISPENEMITEALLHYGVNIVPSNSINNFIEYERFHADMQMLRINDKLFVAENVAQVINNLISLKCDIVICNSLGGKYPANIALNAALVGNKLFCKIDSLPYEVYNYCSLNDIKLVNVNQGYAKCSTLVVSENAIITADPSIYKSATAENIDVLLINSGYIELDGKNYGFIGGASGVIGEYILFFGNINTHPDAERIKDFILKYNMKFASLTNRRLKDIGGFVLLD